ncbi:MAG: hypothetical protein O2955_20750 [Planctomycetota bacterium]|nr:hypothetical protein [Planctomycetota bacterium]MDA1214940.1 hypothetical protein [Planctomycetota bacterium]
MNFLKQLFLRRLTAKQIVLRLVGMSAIYVASIGPMYWYWYESMYLSGPKWIARIYYPLLWLCSYVAFIRRFVDGYIGWWIG